MGQSVRHSAQVRSFLDHCEQQYGLDNDQAEDRLFEWCKKKGIVHNPKKGIVHNPYRSLKNCFNKDDYSSKKYFYLFAHFCNDEFGEDFKDDHFKKSTHVPYYFTKFAAKNRSSASLLGLCDGEFEVIRLGFYDIADESPSFSDRYHLKITRPGGSDLCIFSYSRMGKDGRREPGGSIWEGFAVAAHDYVFLSGVDLTQGKDAVLFVLRGHSEFDTQLLVGMQFAMMSDDPQHVADQGGSNDFAVLRRVAAFRNGKRDRAKLEAAARDWILKEPRGAIVPIHFTPTPSRD